VFTCCCGGGGDRYHDGGVGANATHKAAHPHNAARTHTAMQYVIPLQPMKAL